MLTSEVVRRLNAIDDRLHEAIAGAEKAVAMMNAMHKDLVFLRDEVRLGVADGKKEPTPCPHHPCAARNLGYAICHGRTNRVVPALTPMATRTATPPTIAGR
jgi:hypothetical protein